MKIQSFELTVAEQELMTLCYLFGLFQRMDVDGDGFISEDDFLNACQRVRVALIHLLKIMQNLAILFKLSISICLKVASKLKFCHSQL